MRTEPTQLPIAVMSFDVDFLAIYHSEVTSDKYCLAGLFLTDYCKALPDTIYANFDVHFYESFEIGSKERLL